MSIIEKLLIQGIRSFGPKAEDAQCIDFTSPVTLILGENGCGKTTIIECLKYALTGECPPGSERGKNFVHDPKIFKLVDSLGQIKLQVRNINGQRISVCRSMRISNRRGKTTFETLDSTINYLTSDSKDVGGSNSISKRCVDVDNVMCDFMDVSKPIINNVLFCHQEDSSWPLDEPKKLKEKFDAIFGIVEHNKAIEKIIKMRKEMMEGLKVLQAELNFLAHLKQEMEDKALSLEKAQNKCENIKEECKRCEDEMKPIDERMSEILKIETEIGKYQALKVQLETKQKSCKEQIANLSKKIQNFFEGDLEALDDELRSFDERMSEKQMKQRDMEEDLSKLKIQAQNIQKTYMDLDKKRCMLIQQRQSEQECISERAEKMKELCSRMNIRVEDDLESADRTKVVDLLDDIQNVLMSDGCQIDETLIVHEQDDQKRQAELDTLRIELTKLEENITTLQKQLVQNQQESDGLDKKVIEIEKSTGRLKLLTTEIRRLEESYEAASAAINQENRRKIIAEGKANISKLQEQFHKIDERLTFLNSIAKSLAEIGLKEQELEKKEQEVRRVKSKHGDNLRTIIGKPVEVNFRRTVQTASERLRQEMKDINDKIQVARLKEQSFEIKRRSLKEELVRMEKELEEAKETVFEKCHSTAYVDLLAKCKAAVSKYRVEYSALKSAEDMYKRYIQKIEEEPCCPLCHKSMSLNETADMTNELTDEIHQLPANIKRIEKLLKAEELKHEKLLQLQHIVDKIERLETEIPKRKKDLQNAQAELSLCAEQNENLQFALAEPSEKYNLASTMLGDMSLLDEALKEVTRLKDSIAKLKAKLPEGAETNESAEDLQLEKTTIAAELKNEREHVEKIQHDYEKLVEQLNALREHKNSLKDEQIKLQEGVQALPQLKERQIELVRLLEKISNELRESKDKVQPLKQQLSSKINEKSKIKESNRKKIIEMQKKYDAHKNMNQEIQRLDKEVQHYQKQNLQNEITKVKQMITSCKSDMDKNNTSITSTSSQLDAIKTECVKQETLKRDLKDNRDLKLLQKRQEDFAKEYEVLSKQVGDLDYRKAAREKKALNEQRDHLTVRKSELLGQMGEINNQIRKLKDEMQIPKYKDSVQNHRTAYFKVLTKKSIIEDLARARCAIEWALIKYHKEKMENINKLIREYWRLIYRGNDIDYIEIKTEEGPASASSTTERRRNYNYRVVQSKNDSEIEMRGRCSAGQRVLASLIIRMALAETFSTNCGVLALDEPTTNLDRHNILSLCEALNRIVDDRHLQSNFMLIIITHDEDFISQLCKIESYHRVFRNSDCKSVIRKVRVT